MLVHKGHLEYNRLGRFAIYDRGEYNTSLPDCPHYVFVGELDGILHGTIFQIHLRCGVI